MDPAAGRRARASRQPGTTPAGRGPTATAGLGEVFVFVFFGLVATLGTTYTQADRLTWPSLFGAVGVGALASAILVANNLRDIPTDETAGKVTLAVRLGDRRTRLLYVVLLVVSVLAVLACAAVHVTALLALASYPLVFPVLRTLRAGVTGAALVPVLARTGQFQLVWAFALAVGLALGHYLPFPSS